jgi:hypothetical protein
LQQRGAAVCADPTRSSPPLSLLLSRGAPSAGPAEGVAEGAVEDPGERSRDEALLSGRSGLSRDDGAARFGVPVHKGNAGANGRHMSGGDELYCWRAPPFERCNSSLSLPHVGSLSLEVTILAVNSLTSLTTPSVSKYLSPLTFSCNFDHSSYSNDMSSLKYIQQ